jgi:tetratricopeptide (TPR) repeat protein
LVVAVALAYRPAWQGGLLWDDAGHLTRPALQSVSGLWQIWTDIGATQQYYPLAHTAFWLQHVLWGDAVLGYHLVNILLHATSAFLLALILRRLAIPGALLAAIIFALHPVHVESVAWISELKNTLSTVFYLAAALVYLRFDEQRTPRSYALAYALFVCALLTKTVTATLPVALLLVFWWRRGRLHWRHDAAPLIPFFATGIVAGLVTAWFERSIVGAQGADFELSMIERALLAGRAVWFYLGKLLWPFDLSFVYPRWSISSAAPAQYWYPVALIVLIGGLWLLRRRTRAPLAALLLFCAGLFPALGFIDVFPFRYSFVADHFQYLASLPLIALLAAAITIALRRLKLSEMMTTGVAVVGLALPLGALTWRQSHDYASAEVLYRATLERNPDAWLAHNNLGKLLAERGDNMEARGHFAAVVRLNPRAAEPHMNLGRLLLGADSVDAAIEQLEAALELDPNAANAHNNLGVALLRKNHVRDALAHFEAAVRIETGHEAAIANLAATQATVGLALAQSGRIEEAVPHLWDAVRYNENDAAAHYNLGTALLALGRYKEAAQFLNNALIIRPDFPEARANLDRARQQD